MCPSVAKPLGAWPPNTTIESRRECRDDLCHTFKVEHFQVLGIEHYYEVALVFAPWRFMTLENGDVAASLRVESWHPELLF